MNTRIDCVLFNISLEFFSLGDLPMPLEWLHKLLRVVHCRLDAYHKANRCGKLGVLNPVTRSKEVLLLV